MTYLKLLPVAALLAAPAYAQERPNESCAPGVGSQVPPCIAPLAGAQTYNPERLFDSEPPGIRQQWLQDEYERVESAEIIDLEGGVIRYRVNERPYDTTYATDRPLPQVEPEVDQISDLFR